MKKTNSFSTRSILVFLLLFISANAYCGCGGPEAGMIYETNGFHFAILVGPSESVSEPYTSEVCASTTSRAKSTCFEAVDPLPLYSGQFGTTGAYEAIDNIEAKQKVNKRLVNGQLLLERGEHIYTLTGKKIK